MSESDEDYFGPSLPPSVQDKSVSTKRRKSRSSSSSHSDSSSDSDSSGSSGSPRLKKLCQNASDVKSRTIGPQMPPSLPSNPSNFIGPVIPASLAQAASSDDDSDCIGPMPAAPGQEAHSSSAAQDFERRAQKMKDKILGKTSDTDPTSRETWMTELPSVELSRNLGLTARQFRKGAGPDRDADRSAWTDTPSDKERKEKEGVTSVSQVKTEVGAERDQFFSEQVNLFNKSSRTESLFEMHQRKLMKQRRQEEKKERAAEKKKKKKEKKKHKKGKKEDKKKKEKKKLPERRPFDRDIDLQANRLDAAQRKSLLKKSLELNTKFGKGRQQFL